MSGELKKSKRGGGGAPSSGLRRDLRMGFTKGDTLGAGPYHREGGSKRGG